MAEKGPAVFNSKCPLEGRKFERVNSKTGLKELLPSLVSSLLCVAAVVSSVCPILLQDVAWTAEVNFLSFCPLDHFLGGALGQEEDPLWVETIAMLDEDLHWLLQLNHHKFWCQVRE